ncbi:MOSC domain-containing protein [Actinomadura formosensis]|uniref:MOSC domain-containing protein n=1 Tax=Actinomadura formosensis TaxID=60706 RepID=UPI00082B6638|nr:MOSC domain-containing protein [Actinomadura formosensis]
MEARSGARVLTVSAGTAGDLPYRGRTIRSAFAKKPIDAPVMVTALGLAGDEQGDRVKHGGPDKAVCVFPSEHYRHYERLLGRRLDRPAFGENLTTSGLDEHEVCIGDVLRAGGAVLQVSLPRNPCYRLAARYGAGELPLWFERCGRTGFYTRVLQEGRVRAGDRIDLIDRLHPSATLAEANRLMHHDKRDLPAIRALLVPELGHNWRRTFENRLGGTIEDPTRRRFGPAGPPS